jgi:tetratricopeptide (TPR) repeat protein
MIGQTVSRYRIIEKLGEGGMGVVYLADDITLGRRVALKFLSTTTREYRARFLREVRAVSALTHPNIATVFDYGETPAGQPYMVMELVTGESLSEKLHEGSLPLTEAIRIVSLIGEALGEAHHQGVVHRDVKPSNVIITERSQVKVLDFGLVKQIAEHTVADGDSAQRTLPSTRTRSDVIVGTPLYLSPEQATGRPVDGRSDLFALGAVLYECITGQSAFGGGSIFEIGAQVIHVTPPVPSKINDRIPPELDRITMKAIEKKAEDRYQTAAEFIADLQKVVPTLGEDGYRRGRSTESLTRMRTGSASALTTIIEPFRRPGPNIGIFILAILGVALVTWGIFRWWKPAPYKPNAIAKDWYDKGTDALRNGAFLQASRALEQSVAADPKYPLAHARLAEAKLEMDYADQAKDEMLMVQSLVPNRSNLAASDSLYLEAINATTTRDFPGAIKAYTELVKLNSSEPSVYVDLGRAYEKNEEPNKALESYLEATKRDPDYATALLKTGNLYARQLDQKKASEAFDKAERVYKARGNFEGQAEVEFQRGYLFSKIGKIDDARKHLEHAFQLAKTTDNEYQQVKTLQKLGDVEIDANNVAEGRKRMQEAIELAQARGVDNLYKSGLLDLANTYIAEGKFDDAEKYVKQTLDLSLQQKDARNAARARLVLASIAERRGLPDQVSGYVEQALPFYEQGSYKKELLQALSLLGRAKLLKGEYDAAQQAIEKQLKLAQQFGDQAQQAISEDDLGLLLVKRGNHPEAVKHFSESYRLATTLGAKKVIVVSLIDRANALWRLGRYDEAKQSLDEAAPTAEQKDAAKNLATSYNLARARTALSQRQFAEAISRADQANELGGTFKRFAAVANFTSGMAQVLSGSAKGQAKCQQAVADARETNDPWLLAEALMAFAEARLETHDREGAYKAAVEAQELAARIGSPDIEFNACLLAVRAGAGDEDSAKIRSYTERADKLLAGLQQQWNQNDYQSFLNRPDIQFSRMQTNQLLAQQNNR